MSQPEALEVLIHAKSLQAAQNFADHLNKTIRSKTAELYKTGGFEIEHHGGNNYGLTVPATHRNDYRLQTQAVIPALTEYLGFADNGLELNMNTLHLLDTHFGNLRAKVETGKGVNPDAIFAEVVKKIVPEEEKHRVAIGLKASTGAILEMRSMLETVLTIKPEELYEQRSRLLSEHGVHGTRPEDDQQLQLLTKIRDKEFDAVRELAARTNMQLEKVPEMASFGDYHTGQITLLYQGSNIREADKNTLANAVNVLKEFAKGDLLSHTVLEVNGLPQSDDQYKIIDAAQRTVREMKDKGLLSADAKVTKEYFGAYSATAARISSPAFENRENRVVVLDALLKELGERKNRDGIGIAENDKIFLSTSRLIGDNTPNNDLVILFSREITPQRKAEILEKINTAFSKIEDKVPNVTMGKESPHSSKDPFLKIEFGETITTSTQQAFEKEFERQSWRFQREMQVFRNPETPILNRDTGEPQPNIQHIEVKQGKDPERDVPSSKAVGEGRLNDFLKFCTSVETTVRKQVGVQAALEASQPAPKQTPRGLLNWERSWSQFFEQLKSGTLTERGAQRSLEKLRTELKAQDRSNQSII